MRVPVAPAAASDVAFIRPQSHDDSADQQRMPMMYKSLNLTDHTWSAEGGDRGTQTPHDQGSKGASERAVAAIAFGKLANSFLMRSRK